MKRAFCCLFIVGLALTAGGNVQAGSPTVQITATITGAGSLTAVATGTPFMGYGKLNTYNLQVTGGGLTGRYVTLTGTVVATGGQTTPFRIDADSVSGAVKLTYMGSKGTLITLLGKGTVKIVN